MVMVDDDDVDDDDDDAIAEQRLPGGLEMCAHGGAEQRSCSATRMGHLRFARQAQQQSTGSVGFSGDQCCGGCVPMSCARGCPGAAREQPSGVDGSLGHESTDVASKPNSNWNE